MSTEKSCAGAVHGWLPANRARLPLTSILVDAGLTLLGSENVSVHVLLSCEYVLTVKLERISIWKVPVVVWLLETVR